MSFTSLERQIIRLMHIFLDTVAILPLCLCGKICVGVFVGPAPFSVCFAVFPLRRYAYLAGGLACRCVFWLFCCGLTLIATMHVTNSVHVFSIYRLFQLEGLSLRA